jgi:hypothetical protein
MHSFIDPSNQQNAKTSWKIPPVDPSLQEAIILTAMADAPATQKQNNYNLERQAKARRIKEELIEEKCLENATEEYIDVLYYYQMYFLPACWKTDPKIAVDIGDYEVFCIERK